MKFRVSGGCSTHYKYLTYLKYSSKYLAKMALEQGKHNEILDVRQNFVTHNYFSQTIGKQAWNISTFHMIWVTLLCLNNNSKDTVKGYLFNWFFISVVFLSVVLYVIN
jgi:hypothetical protein